MLHQGEEKYPRCRLESGYCYLKALPAFSFYKSSKRVSYSRYQCCDSGPSFAKWVNETTEIRSGTLQIAFKKWVGVKRVNDNTSSVLIALTMNLLRVNLHAVQCWRYKHKVMFSVTYKTRFGIRDLDCIKCWLDCVNHEVLK